LKFIDTCELSVAAGNGGNGAVAFRREKFVPFGGPAGGDGGKGGDIVFVADPGLGTLMDLRYAHTLRAKNGEHGGGKDCYGRGAEDLRVRVPVGTVVLDAETREQLYDITREGQEEIVAKGGRGGRGNIHFATSFDRAPRRAEPGEEGELKRFRLELKVMADVGLLGFPNVGKSTFVSACSRARPKIADYPFTTLEPHLGVVRIDEDAAFVIADIPGLIPGAAEGAGLGIRFLKHVERTRALLHLVTLDYGEGREPFADYVALSEELRKFSPDLAKRPVICAMSKADIPEVREAFPRVQKEFAKKKIELRLVSAATGEGMRELLVELFKLIHRAPDAEEEAEEEAPTQRQKQKQTQTQTQKPKKKVTAKKKAAPAPKKKVAAKKKPIAAKKKKATAPKKKPIAKKPKKKASRAR
jgi:GTP-binding protein